MAARINAEIPTRNRMGSETTSRQTPRARASALTSFMFWLVGPAGFEPATPAL